jgi:hypothetical protein
VRQPQGNEKALIVFQSAINRVFNSRFSAGQSNLMVMGVSIRYQSRLQFKGDSRRAKTRSNKAGFNPLSIASSIQGKLLENYCSGQPFVSIRYQSRLQFKDSANGLERIAEYVFQSAINRVFNSRRKQWTGEKDFLTSFQSAINRVFNSRSRPFSAFIFRWLHAHLG